MRGVTAVDNYFRHLSFDLQPPVEELKIMTLEIGYGATRIALVNYLNHRKRVMVPYGTVLEYPEGFRKLYYKMPSGLRATNLRHPTYRRGESIRDSDILEYEFRGEPVLRINVSDLAPCQPLLIKKLPEARRCVIRATL